MYRPEIHENNGATKIMFPQEARLRNFTYASTMTLDLNMEIKVRYGDKLQQIETHFKKLPKIHIGKMPIMLKSKICVLNQYKHLHTDLVGECRFDPGGYFIISGSEKTILAQERAAENKIYCLNSLCIKQYIICLNSLWIKQYIVFVQNLCYSIFIAI